ncbi:MAG: lycopene cyclase [Gammaproteobacteria bacterium]|nr:MAG: lycopene cyclase [Gammaproteobacteria bacterium]
MNPDLILVGGGLANSLIAWRLRARRPSLRLLLLERGERLGGNHTWCFHGADLRREQHAWLAPLVAQQWPGHEIIFPRRRRRLPGSYHCLLSDRLHEALAPLLGEQLITGAEVSELRPDGVKLADGRSFGAPAVIDGRGDPGSRALDVRFQKFFGQELRLAAPAGLAEPILMDATVPQRDGFRFIYTLPLAPDRLLVEDTRYSDGPALAVAEMREAIADYAAARGWQVSAVEREEQGALPVVLGGDLAAYLAEQPELPRAGVRAGLFHYTTGYSLPEAVRLADELAALPESALRSAPLADRIRARSFTLWRRGGYFRMLNRMLFLAGPPEERYRVLQHFYRLPAPLIERFYAGRPSWSDRVRILSGRPPVPVARALGSVVGLRQERAH